MDMELEARDISRKWVSRLGIGYHPDNSPDSYDPELNDKEQMEYAFDMRKLRRMERISGLCPYEAGINALIDAGLIEG